MWAFQDLGFVLITAPTKVMLWSDCRTPLCVLDFIVNVGCVDLMSSYTSLV